jgi:ubiquinone/menaquinone biosynthesis C-methylase UbiE
MSLFTTPRRPEPEVMDERLGVEAYASAAAQAYLDALDDTFVVQVLSLGIQEGMALDAGSGPGSIPMKIARRCPMLRMVGVDRSAAMIGLARKRARAPALDDRAEFLLADASQLCFADASFDLVISNSLIHHLSHPVETFNEMVRVTKPRGKILMRDLRRPPRLAFAAHVAWHGRHYSGRMKELYRDSVRAAYTPSELCELVQKSLLSGAQILFHHQTHLGLLWQKPGRG